MNIDRVPPEQWAAFVRTFVRQHAGAHVCVELSGDATTGGDPRLDLPGGPLIPSDTDRRVVGHEMTLRGITVDAGEDGRLGLTIDAQHSGGEPAIYIVPQVTALQAHQPGASVGGTLRIDSAGGQSLLMRLAAPIMPPETLQDQGDSKREVSDANPAHR